jgi:hypothetical protein
LSRSVVVFEITMCDCGWGLFRALSSHTCVCLAPTSDGTRGSERGSVGSSHCARYIATKTKLHAIMIPKLCTDPARVGRPAKNPTSREYMEEGATNFDVLMHALFSAPPMNQGGKIIFTVAEVYCHHCVVTKLFHQLATKCTGKYITHFEQSS